ncbi:MAG: hypothetical protein Kow0059_21350 [Candidatus Sumerlaeia bacterium]
MSIVRIAGSLAILLTLWAGGPFVIGAQDSAPPSAAEGDQVQKADVAGVNAQDVFDAMNRFYGSLAQMAVNVKLRVTADVHDRPELFHNTFDYAFARPGSYFRRQTSEQGEVMQELYSDGKQTTIYYADANRYVVEPAPLDLAGLLDSRNPGPAGIVDILTLVGFLIQSDPAAVMGPNVAELKFGGSETLDGATVHRLKMKFSDAPMEMWIEAGDRPFVRRARMDVTRYISLRGLPDGTPLVAELTFSGWQTTGIGPERFTFRPPAGAERRASVDEIRSEQALEQMAEESRNHPLTGKAAPDFTLPLLDGGRFRLSDHKGKKIVVLDFWASWCQPCVASMPAYVAATDEFKDRGVVFYAVNFRQDKRAIERFLTQQNIQPHVVLDADGKVSAQFGAPPIPLTVIVGKDGLIKRVHTGAPMDRALAKKMLSSDLEAVLAEK